LTSPTGDKRPFVLETGLIGTVPVQRNRALGRARSLRARLAQLDARTQLTADQIANEVRQATIAYQAARQRLQQATLGQELARQTLRFGEIAFQAGEIDILLLNIYEQAYADAGQEVVDAQAAMHIALARRLTARGEMLLDESQGPPGIGPLRNH
jgi:outer membrane protein, heavy metal efflux system